MNIERLMREFGSGLAYWNTEAAGIAISAAADQTLVTNILIMRIADISLEIR
jgi:hypothetical protein